MQNFLSESDGPYKYKKKILDTYMNIKLFEVTFMNDKYIDD